MSDATRRRAHSQIKTGAEADAARYGESDASSRVILERPKQIHLRRGQGDTSDLELDEDNDQQNADDFHSSAANEDDDDDGWRRLRTSVFDELTSRDPLKQGSHAQFSAAERNSKCVTVISSCFATTCSSSASQATKAVPLTGPSQAPL